MIFLDIIGIIAFTISGFLKAIKNNLDILGIINISLITAFAGGVIRDITINKTPYIFLNYYPLITSLITILILLKYHKKIYLNYKKLYMLFDSIGLSIFTITGVLVGLNENINIFGIVFLGFITAIGGGIIRDILLNEIPNIFKNDFYASISLIIIITMLLFNKLYILNETTIYIIFIYGVILRLISKKYKWKLKKLK